MLENLTTLDYRAWLIGLFIILTGAKEGFELFSYFVKKFRIKTGLQEDKDVLNNRVTTLERHDNWQYNQINKISKGIEEIQDSLLKSEIESMRWEILDFASSLCSGRRFSKEQFEHVISTYERYDKLLEQHELTNGLVTSSMEVIEEKYKDCLKHGFT